MQVTTIDCAKGRLDQLILQVESDAEPVLIFMDDAHKAVLLSEREYSAWQETDYLLANPANARHLVQSMREADEGITQERDLIEP